MKRLTLSQRTKNNHDDQKVPQFKRHFFYECTYFQQKTYFFNKYQAQPWVQTEEDHLLKFLL